jgi:hypothetical protein
MKNKIIFSVAVIIFVIFFASPVFADTQINLQIRTNTETIYNNDINVSPCDSESDGVLKETPYCALVQSGTPSDWSGLWVNSINNIVNNDDGNGAYWMWLVNLNIDTSPTSPYSLSSKQYILQSNDNILFYYNTNPLDITVDNENPKVGESIKIKVKELGLDSFWNPIWNNTVGGKVIINGNTYDLDANGEFSFEITNENTLSIKAQKDNFIDSKELSIQPEQVRRSSGSLRGGNIFRPIIIEKTFSVENALKFLASNQKSDGSYGAPMYTDWVAIAVGAGDDSSLKSSISNYIRENNLNSSILTDNERRAMALMALGINPYIGTNINYIKKITDSFDGTQFGDISLENDDIFALIVLKNAGYTINDEIIIKNINHIISKQSPDGSWDSVDMTSAGIQALRGFENISGVLETISKAENYLISNQAPDNGFGTSFSTSWVLQSLFNNNQILKADKYLVLKQEIDGGMEKITDNIDTRIWATAYVIPAILHKPWSEILNNFSKPVVSDTPIIIKKVAPSATHQEGGNIIKKVKILEEKKEDLKILVKKEENLKQKQDLLTENKTPTVFNYIWESLKFSFLWLWVHLDF